MEIFVGQMDAVYFDLQTGVAQPIRWSKYDQPLVVSQNLGVAFFPTFSIIFLIFCKKMMGNQENLMKKHISTSEQAVQQLFVG